MLKRDGVIGDNARAAPVARQADFERQIENKCGAIEAGPSRQAHQRAAVFAFEVGRVGNGQASESQAHLDDRMHEIEGERRDILIGRIIADHGSAMV